MSKVVIWTQLSGPLCLWQCLQVRQHASVSRSICLKLKMKIILVKPIRFFSSKNLGKKKILRQFFSFLSSVLIFCRKIRRRGKIFNITSIRSKETSQSWTYISRRGLSSYMYFFQLKSGNHWKICEHNTKGIVPLATKQGSAYFTLELISD